MKEYIKNNSKTIIAILLIIAIATIGITLAADALSINVDLATGTYNVDYSGTVTLPTTTLEPVYDSVIDSINSEGKDSSGVFTNTNAAKVMIGEFTVKGVDTNPTDIPIIYDVSLTELELPTELQSHLLKWRLYKNGNTGECNESNDNCFQGSFSKDFDGQANNRLVLTDIQQDLPASTDTADSYILYIWISEECTGEITACTTDMNTAPLMGKTFTGNIRIEVSTKGKKELIRFTGDSGATLVQLGLQESYKDTTPDFSKIAPEIATYKVSESATSTQSLTSTETGYYITYADSYSFDEAAGTYTLENGNVAVYSSIYSSLVGKYVTNVVPSSSSTMESLTGRGKIYKVADATYSSGTGVITYTELTKEVATYDLSDTGIFKTEDDLGTSYYFRGDVTNNYVYFAGFYWRIIRINGDGTIRMIYDGTSAHANGESSTDRYVTTRAFNTSDNDNTYVGYMYGTAGSSTYEATHANTNNSTIKTYLEDTWYANNIKDTTYEQYIADAIYCNDRSLSTASSSYTGIGTTSTYYAAYQRLVNNKAPILTCTQENDRFTIGDSIDNVSTNGDLTYPVGLITADEVVLAGGKNNTTNYNYYLYTGSWYWTMSPSYFNGSHAVGFSVHNSGSLLSNGYVNFDDGVRPVVSLESTAIRSGTGTTTDPFKTNS